MFPYFICLIIALLPAIFIKKDELARIDSNASDISHTSREEKKRNIALFLIPLVLLIAFKGETVGADTQSYNKMYMFMAEDAFAGEISYERIEIGFKVLIKSLSSIWENPQFLHIVYACFFFLAYKRFIKDNAVNAARFVVLFMGMSLFSFYLTGIRQSLAMLICLYAYACIKDKKPVKFLVIVLFATLFHKAALFFLPAYSFARVKVTKNKILMYIGMLLFVAIANKLLFDFAADFFDLNYGIEETGNGYISVAIMAIITIFSFMKMQSLLALNPNNRYLINLNAIHTAMWVLRLFSRTAERPSMFYTVFTILLVEQMILTIEDYRERFLANAAVMCFFGLYFIYRINGAGIVPFVFFWQ
ncbi:MAG: EpsG family protein [Clostridia bacterium]|nr:EpsG family protein [Clostridia bacterium]